MKNSFQFYALLFLAVFTVSLTSCTKDKDDEPTLDEQIQGDWVLFNLVEEGEVVDFGSYYTFTVNFTSTAPGEGNYSAVAEATVGSYVESVEGIYVLDGNQITMTPKGPALPVVPVVAIISVGENLLMTNVPGDDSEYLMQFRR
jgi:hypothetical protein